jgi:hypothetical protein
MVIEFELLITALSTIFSMMYFWLMSLTLDTGKIFMNELSSLQIKVPDPIVAGFRAHASTLFQYQF